MRFSIVTIAYNAKDTIEDTMKSVLNQDYNNFEYIIVDGGSKDGTVEIVKKYIPLFNNRGINVLFSSEKDEGISDAFNKGIKKATGEIIGLINAGDCILKDCLSTLDNEWMEDDQIVYGNTISVDKKNKLVYLREIPKNVELSKMRYNGLIFTHQSAFVKKDVYLNYGFYDTKLKYIMDSDLFTHFQMNGVKFRYINKNLVSMLYGGISSNTTIGMLKEKIALSEKYGGYRKEKLITQFVISKIKAPIKNLARKNPKLWYRLIGEERWIDDPQKYF